MTSSDLSKALMLDDLVAVRDLLHKARCVAPSDAVAAQVNLLDFLIGRISDRESARTAGAGGEAKSKCPHGWPIGMSCSECSGLNQASPTPAPSPEPAPKMTPGMDALDRVGLSNERPAPTCRKCGGPNPDVHVNGSREAYSEHMTCPVPSAPQGELRACPMCQSPASITDAKYDGPADYWDTYITCTSGDCGVEGPKVLREHGDDEAAAIQEAIDGWNRRHG